MKNCDVGGGGCESGTSPAFKQNTLRADRTDETTNEKKSNYAEVCFSIIFITYTVTVWTTHHKCVFSNKLADHEFIKFIRLTYVVVPT